MIAIRSLLRRLDRTAIENKSWEYILVTYDSAETFFFLDPPYPDGTGAAYEGWDAVTLQHFCSVVTNLKG